MLLKKFSIDLGSNKKLLKSAFQTIINLFVFSLEILGTFSRFALQLLTAGKQLIKKNIFIFACSKTQVTVRQ